MSECKTNKTVILPQIPYERGLSDAKMKEIHHLGDPPYEQEESDTM